mgnify:CR=1 FL=1
MLVKVAVVRHLCRIKHPRIHHLRDDRVWPVAGVCQLGHDAFCLGALPRVMGRTDFAQFMAEETARWGTVVRAVGATAD